MYKRLLSLNADLFILLLFITFTFYSIIPIFSLLLFVYVFSIQVLSLSSTGTEDDLVETSIHVFTMLSF